MSTMLQRHVEALLQKDPPRAKSLCMTMLGDAIYPHGGRLWLSDLIKLAQVFGVNERLLRTSIFRLVSQRWLWSKRFGRRSLYGFSELGLELTQAAAQRVYGGEQNEWNGTWTTVVAPRFGNASVPGMVDLRRELIWAGFGQVAPGIFALPSDHTGTARKILSKLDLAAKTLVLASRDLNSDQGLSLSDLAGQCWNLEFVAGQHLKFEEDFRPILDLLSPELEPHLAFTVRTLAVHRWRRVVLHDPQL